MQINKKFFYFGLGINIFTIVLVLLFISFLPPEVPLFYGKPLGENQLTTPFGLMIPPSLIGFLTILNFLLSKKIKNHFLQKALVLTGLLASILVTITILKIVFLVGSF